jgi:CRP-like cAMP-binding protein
MPDLIDTIRKQIDARLNELRPIVQEAAELEAALSALAGTASVGAASTPQRRARQRSAVSSARRGRPRGQSREKVVEYLRAHPGSTAGDVAKALGLKRNSVSTQLSQLAKSGAIAKSARGYSAT